MGKWSYIHVTLKIIIIILVIIIIIISIIIIVNIIIIIIIVIVIVIVIINKRHFSTNLATMLVDVSCVSGWNHVFYLQIKHKKSQSNSRVQNRLRYIYTIMYWSVCFPVLNNFAHLYRSLAMAAIDSNGRLMTWCGTHMLCPCLKRRSLLVRMHWRRSQVKAYKRFIFLFINLNSYIFIFDRLQFTITRIWDTNTKGNCINRNK